MLMNSEHAKAMSDNLKRELRNIKEAQKSERIKMFVLIEKFFKEEGNEEDGEELIDFIMEEMTPDKPFTSKEDKDER